MTEQVKDTRFEKALSFANLKATFALQLQNIKLEFENSKTISHNSGLFKIDTVLISYINSMLTQGYNELAVLDSNQNPIMIKDLAVFLKEITDTYNQAVNSYYLEYSKLKKQRNITGLIS